MHPQQIASVPGPAAIRCTGQGAVPWLLVDVMLQARGVVAETGLASQLVSMSGRKAPDGSLRRLAAPFSEALVRTGSSRSTSLHQSSQTSARFVVGHVRRLACT